jgi:hypothetical protein
MLFHPNREERLVQLEEQLRLTQTITFKVMAELIAQACARFSAHSEPAKARIDRLIAFGAWTDAALALVELELPQWKLRRLLYEDGEWHCSFSKQPALPVGFDDTAEGSHEILPLAILIAFIEALRQGLVSIVLPLRTVPQIHPAQDHVVCCDNFA